MRRMLLILAPLALAACAPAYEAMPTSPYQWERRQEGIERREAERQRLCRMLDKDSDRYKRDCRRAGDAD